MQTGGRKSKKYWLNLVRAFLLSLLAVTLLVCYVIYPWNRGNARLRPPRTYACCQTPVDFGMDYEEINLTTRDGLTLKSWYIASRNQAAVLIAHGASGNRASHLDQAKKLNESGFGVLLIELRGHGESDGSIITFSGEDILAGVQFLKTRPDVEADRIGVMGCSLGAMTAIQAAALTPDIQSVIADGASPVAIEDEPPPQNIGEALMLPAYFSEYIVWKLQGAAPPMPITRAVGVINPRPILFIAGGELKSEVQAMQNFYDYTPGPKEFWIVPGAGHCGGWQVQNETYAQKMIQFFERTLLSSH